MNDVGMIRFVCPKCHKRIGANPELAGRRIRCPYKACGQALGVPLQRENDLELTDGPQSRPTLVWLAGGIAFLVIAIAVAIWLLTGDQKPKLAQRIHDNETVAMSGSPGSVSKSEKGPAKESRRARPKESKNPAETSPPKSQAEEPPVEEEGKFWSSPKEFRVGTKAGVGPVLVTGGDGLKIWPAEDRAFDTDADKQTITFHWSLRRDQHLSAEENPPQGKFHYKIQGDQAATAIMALKFEGGPHEGFFHVNEDFKEACGDEAIFWVETETAGKSNLVLVKLKAKEPAKIAEKAKPKEGGENNRRADPIAEGEGDGIAISLREVKPHIKSKEVKRLFGATRLLGFLLAEDQLGKDCILICAQEAKFPTLKLDDLAVAYRNVTAGDARPACTIDPRPETMKDLAIVGQKLMASRNTSLAEAQLEKWQELAEGLQDVKVFNVDPASSFANTMVDADYDLKSICNGTENLAGIKGFCDLVLQKMKAEISKKGTMDTPMNFYNRFWFTPGDVKYRTDGSLFLLSRCQVVLRTEQETLTQEGNRIGASKANPLAKEFAQQFTARFADVAKAKKVYRELENLYRAVALADLMVAETKKLSESDVLVDSLGLAEVSRGEARETVPGKSGLKKLQGTIPGGTYVVWLPSCGGVSMQMILDNSNKVNVPAKESATVTPTILSNRQGPRVVAWRFQLERLRD